MKKLTLTLIAPILSCCIYGQNSCPPMGNVAIGTTSTTYPLNVGGSANSLNSEEASIKYVPTTTTGSVAGIVSQTVANPAMASAGAYYGVFGEAGDNLGITTGFSSAMTFIAVGGSIVHRGTGTVGGGSALYAGGVSCPNGGMITTAYGLFIAPMNTSGVTNSFGICQYSANDKNYFAGNVGIGTVDDASWKLATSTYKLAVNGGVISTLMVVKLQANWPDFVFKKNYDLPSLTDVKTYIVKNQRLPEMPSEQDVTKDGLNLGEMNRLLLKKVEELTLYLIEQDKKEKEQEARINKLEEEVKSSVKK